MTDLPQLFAAYLPPDSAPATGLPSQLLTRAQELGMTVSQGKVKDGVNHAGELWLYHSDRLSAYDAPVGLSPGRGQIICELSSWWFKALTQAHPHLSHHFIHQPAPRVMILKHLKPILVEVIVRRSYCGSMVGDVQRAHFSPYEHQFRPHQLNQLELYDTLPSPCVHLTTKANLGKHDITQSVDACIDSNLITARQWEQITATALSIFNWAAAIYAQHHWWLADTKFEFGIHPQDPERIMLIDEILTPDTSRIWSLNSSDYDAATMQPPLKLHNHQPVSWDKDILRRYLKSRSSPLQANHQELNQIITVLVQKYAKVLATLAPTLSSYHSPHQPEDGS